MFTVPKNGDFPSGKPMFQPDAYRVSFKLCPTFRIASTRWHEHIMQSAFVAASVDLPAQNLRSTFSLSATNRHGNALPPHSQRHGLRAGGRR